MAVLVSPGVNVSVVDESAYGAPGAGTVPLMVVATRQDKSDPTGSEADGLAKFTKSAQAGKVVKVTSQRELTQYFGNPTFTKSGTTIVQGSETSEYGLMAAYSYLGQGSQAFVVRANLSLGQLEASTTTPTATYATNGGLWLDTDASKYGIHEWSATNNSWENKIPTVEINATGTQATIDGDTGHTPATAASAATNDTYLVVIHVDNEIATTTDRQMSLQYFHGTGGAWELIDNSLAAGTATYDEHYSAPSSPSAGDIWIKTTSPGNGLDLKLYEYNTSSTSFVLQTVQGISTTQADGAGAITDFVPQNGSSTTALSATTAVVGNYLADQQGNTKATIVVREITTGGAVGAITSGDVLAQTSTPTATAASGTYWFDNTINSLDLYKVNSGNYTRVQTANETYSTTAPTGPSAGDLWIDTTLAGENQANERAYPKIYQRNAGNSAWVLHSNTDQTTSNGVLFADITDTADDNTNGGNATTVTGAPSAAVYPDGMVVVNMAQSKNSVRAWNGTAWRNGAANHADGSGAFGRYAQRKVIATSMQGAIAGSDLRDPQYKYSLIASPNYPELVDEMVTLNSDRGETAFIVIDSPMRKDATSVISWANNSGSASENGEDGLVTKNTYSAVYYPSGQTTEPVDGATVAVPASHMALYTIAYNDNISFQWFAPAGTTRGVVQNASAVGYITTEGEFKAISLTQGQRDSLYTAKVNPITTFPGQGTIVFGQKTLHATTSSLDRVNVARLVAYLRERFDEIARPFLFEINDAQTRARAKVVFERFLADILSRRGLNDFAVVCDETNNTAARIDRNEFYVDVAIEPAKAAEFIYIPIRLVNTGTLNSTN